MNLDFTQRSDATVRCHHCKKECTILNPSDGQVKLNCECIQTKQPQFEILFPAQKLISETESYTDKIADLESKLKTATEGLRKADEAVHDSDCDFVTYKLQRPCSCFKRFVKEALKKI